MSILGICLHQAGVEGGYACNGGNCGAAPLLPIASSNSFSKRCTPIAHFLNKFVNRRGAPAALCKITVRRGGLMGTIH
jgi:hypothetical protein